jgi:hypothetical protein
MRVAVVLDTTAVVRFAQGDDLAVGELLGEVADEQAFAVVPVSAIALAHASLRKPDQQILLGWLVDANPSVLTVPMPADEGRLIGQYAVELGLQLGLAHAVREAERNKAQLVTAEGDVVRAAFGEMYGIVDL